jgi:hypothetical protein
VQRHIAVAIGNRAEASQKASLESVFLLLIFVLSLLAETIKQSQSMGESQRHEICDFLKKSQI